MGKKIEVERKGLTNKNIHREHTNIYEYGVVMQKDTLDIEAKINLNKGRSSTQPYILKSRF